MRGLSAAVAVLYACCSLWLACDNGSIAGGTTETGNPQAVAVITGTVIDSAYRPVVRAEVRCMPQNYNPLAGGGRGDSLFTMTDSAGRFHLYPTTADTFTVSVTGPLSEHGQIVGGVAVDTCVGDTVKELGTVRLRRARDVTVMVDSSAYVPQSALYVPGTDHAAPVDTGGTALFESLAADRISLVYYLPGADSTVARFDDVSVRDTVMVGRPSGGSSSGSGSFAF